MTRAGERLALEAFLAEAAPRIGEAQADTLAKLHGVLDHLTAHLSQHPELNAQVGKLRATLPLDLEHAEAEPRATAAAEARRVAADIKHRWIEAEAPPLVGEIDDRLAEIAQGLDDLAQPGVEALRQAAVRIDQLSRNTRSLEHIESRYLPWAVGGGVLFLVGLLLFFLPGILEYVPPLASFWTIIICLGALPAVGVHYAFKVLPRTRADTEIDGLNRTHFLTNGGLYFPEGDGPACVVLVDWPPPPMSEGETARQERRKSREKLGPLW